jgi:hypothetical protein
MKADALNPRSLFDGNVHYEIPVFQRPYVWDEENQWAPLWGDIIRVAEKLVHSGHDAELVSQVGGHFLGAIVYESKPPLVGDVTRHLVIDGQQRTTTLQVLIDAVQQVIEERGHELMAEDLESLILNKASGFKGKPERFKLWPSRGDRQAFTQAMDPQDGWSGEHRIVSAHEFFRKEAAGWLSGEPDDDGVSPPGSEEERVLALSSTLQHRLFVVAINLTGHDDSQLIFETLNDRGTPLLKADLIKNWVFQRGDKVSADVEKWPETYWDDFDDEWWREEISQGRHLRSRIDIFLQYWLTMRLRDDVQTDDVFRRFTEHASPLMADAERAEILLAALRRDANTFRNFAQLSEDTPEGAFYSRVVETMELAATSPLLLWMLSDNHAVADTQIAIGLNALESWVIRRTLLRYTMKDVNKMMVAILKVLDGVPEERVGDAVRDFLARQNADARVWPTDADMASHLPAGRLYGNIRQGRLRVVLEAVEMSLRSERHEAVAVPPKLEIEHVMPQGWRSHWDTTPKLGPDEAAERDHRVNRLGNLTLITRKLNGALSNRPWTDSEARPLGGSGPDAGKGKRSLLDKYSLLVLSKGLTSQHPESWTEDDIETRSRYLTEQICSVWPGPPASASVVEVPMAGSSADSSSIPSDTAADLADNHEPDEADADEPRGDDVTEGLLRRQFDAAMKDVYIRARAEAGYTATYFLGMLSDHGGVETARRLLHSSTVSDGFVALWERRRLDLTVENVILKPEFEALFGDEEREIARARLGEYGFAVE